MILVHLLCMWLWFTHILRKQGVFDSGVMDAPWGVSDNQPTDQDLLEKFEMVTGPVLGKSRSQALQDVIWNLEREPAAALLLELATVKD